MKEEKEDIVEKELGTDWMDSKDFYEQYKSIIPAKDVLKLFEEFNKEGIYPFMKKDGDKKALISPNFLFLWIATLKDLIECKRGSIEVINRLVVTINEDIGRAKRTLNDLDERVLFEVTKELFYLRKKEEK